MKQKSVVIRLFDLIGGGSAFGNDEGRAVFQKLQTKLDQFPATKIFGISLSGVTRTDASFPRESVFALAKVKRGEKGFFLRDFESRDLLDNWDYAAKAKEQTMLVMRDKGFEIIGPPLNESTIELISFIFKKESATTSMVSEKFDISVQNASGKLKKLYEQGLVMASKEVAETGGLEYVFQPIK